MTDYTSNNSKHEVNEIKQENELLKSINSKLNSDLSETSKNLNENVSLLKKEISEKKELAQEKIIQNEHHKTISFRDKQKYKKYIAIGAIALIAMTTWSLIITNSAIELMGDQHLLQPNNLKSMHTIQNLRGDEITTVSLWKIPNNSALFVSIQNSANNDQDEIEKLKNSIISTESISVDNSLLHKGPKGTTSTMYLDWAGAMQNLPETEYQIPHNIQFVDSGQGDIVIELVSYSSPDGFSGWTNTIVDDSENQILKSRITIFNANSLSSSDMETIVRHEFGHALGLGHSTAPEDLMHPTIETNFPYISECDVDAIVSLYDGNTSSEVICRI